MKMKIGTFPVVDRHDLIKGGAVASLSGALADLSMRDGLCFSCHHSPTPTAAMLIARQHLENIGVAVTTVNTIGGASPKL